MAHVFYCRFESPISITRWYIPLRLVAANSTRPGNLPCCCKTTVTFEDASANADEGRHHDNDNDNDNLMRRGGARCVLATTPSLDTRETGKNLGRACKVRKSFFILSTYIVVSNAIAHQKKRPSNT